MTEQEQKAFDQMRQALKDIAEESFDKGAVECANHALAAANAVQPQAQGEREEKVVSLPTPLSAFHLKLEIAELIQSHKYKGLRSIEVLGVFQFLSADIISGSST